MIRGIILLMLLAIPAGLTGCTSMMVQLAKDGKDYVQGKNNLNLVQINYAAADYIVKQADSFIAEGALIRVTPLTHVESPEVTSELAALISADIGQRFVQLGYNTDLSAVVPEEDRSFYATPARAQIPAHMLSGTIRDGKQNNRNGFRIDLRMVQKEDRRITGSFSYFLPDTRKLRALAAPKPLIFAIE